MKIPPPHPKPRYWFSDVQWAWLFEFLASFLSEPEMVLNHCWEQWFSLCSHISITQGLIRNTNSWSMLHNYRLETLLWGLATASEWFSLRTTDKREWVELTALQSFFHMLNFSLLISERCDTFQVDFSESWSCSPEKKSSYSILPLMFWANGFRNQRSWGQN